MKSLVTTVGVFALAACSTSSGAPGTPAVLDSGAAADGASAGDGGGDDGSGGGLGAPDCNGPCCPLPTEGSLCTAADDGQSCPTSTDCPGGLTLAFSLACRQGSWQRLGDMCPAIDGGATSEGCPARQPANNDPCSAPDGTGGCSYHLSCAPKPCDAGAQRIAADAGNAGGAADGATAGYGCVSLSGKVAGALCLAGHWRTEPLGSCP